MEAFLKNATALGSSYGFWLACVSVLALTAERLRPWRRQALLRPGFGRDAFWFAFNGYALGHLLEGFFKVVLGALDSGFHALALIEPSKVQALAGLSLGAQIAILFVVADFLEWLVHNLLHRVDALWRFHRVHHSIRIMDWIGNFRFHWFEVIVYSTIKHLPLLLLGARPEAILSVAVISTSIGHLNHSNLNISWGPLRFLLNSPRMHIWHHDRELHGKAGVNFAISLSAWDWLFRTAYMPADKMQPERLGFAGDEKLGNELWRHFFVPFLDTAAPGSDRQ